MFKIKYNELKIDHIVTFNREKTIFACARENGEGRTRLFLVFGGGTDRVYARNGRADSWEVLGSNEAETIRRKIQRATEQGIAVYQFNGSSKIAQAESITA